jgi:hypothetical protein
MRRVRWLRALTPLLFLLGSACPDVAPLHDYDGDGSLDAIDCAPADPAVQGDCDDQDAGVFPGQGC